MDLGIANKRALVLSASGGLGSAIAVALAREGATVCLAGRNEQALAAAAQRGRAAGRTEEALPAAAQRVRATGAPAHSFVWDLAHGAQWSAGIASVLQRVGGIDILVNNTGGPPPGPAHGHALD